MYLNLLPAEKYAQLPCNKDTNPYNFSAVQKGRRDPCYLGTFKYYPSLFGFYTCTVYKTKFHAKVNKQLIGVIKQGFNWPTYSIGEFDEALPISAANLKSLRLICKTLQNFFW